MGEALQFLAGKNVDLRIWVDEGRGSIVPAWFIEMYENKILLHTDTAHKVLQERRQEIRDERSSCASDS